MLGTLEMLARDGSPRDRSLAELARPGQAWPQQDIEDSSTFETLSKTPPRSLALGTIGEGVVVFLFFCSSG